MELAAGGASGRAPSSSTRGGEGRPVETSLREKKNLRKKITFVGLLGDHIQEAEENRTGGTLPLFEASAMLLKG